MDGDGTPVRCTGAEVRGFYAWDDNAPPGPSVFWITGEVQVGNPGIRAHLLPHDGPGVPETRTFDLVLTQVGDVSPQVMTWIPVRFKGPEAGGHTRAIVHCAGDVIVDVPIIQVG